MYQCNICTYNTDIKCNYDKHNKSKKHIILFNKKDKKESVHNVDIIQNEVTALRLAYTNLNKKEVSEIFLIESFDNDQMTEFDLIETENNNKTQKIMHCEYCNKTFSHRSSLSRHKKEVCNDNLNDTKVEVVMKENEMLKKKVKTLEDDKLFLQNTTRDTGSFAKDSMSTIKYIMTHFKTAPVLQTIDNTKLLEYVGDDITNMNELINNIIYNHRHKILDRYIGDIIIKIYKKDDPNEQSIWSSDVQRFNYIIRQLIGKKINWCPDKKGIALIDMIIGPLLDYIKKKLQEYIQENNMNDKTIKGISKSMIETILNNMMTANLIIVDIDNKVLEENILKYVTPHFQLLNKNIKEKILV
jgi:hypothetical protein